MPLDKIGGSSTKYPIPIIGAPFWNDRRKKGCLAQPSTGPEAFGPEEFRDFVPSPSLSPIRWGLSSLITLSIRAMLGNAKEAAL